LASFPTGDSDARVGEVPGVELELSAEDLAFRDAVRAFLAAHLTPQLAQAGRRMTSVFCDKTHSLAWQRILGPWSVAATATLLLCPANG
jgi:hypothetical protein